MRADESITELKSDDDQASVLRGDLACYPGRGFMLDVVMAADDDAQKQSSGES